MEATLRIKYYEGDEGYIATLDCCEGLSAFGRTREEALLELSLALQGYMEVMIEDGEKLVEKGG